MLENNDNICRLCLSKEGLMLPIFRNYSLKNEVSFRSKIMSCASIEVFADDNLPMKVCFMCVHQVEKFYQFQTMCENSDAVLRSTDNKPFCTEDKEVFCNDKSTFTSGYYSNELFVEEKTFDTTCFVCSCIFVTNEMLIEHLTKSHTNLELFICKTCQISFPDIQQFKNHLNLRHKLTCDYCDCVFKYHKNLREHLKNHSNFLNCKFCKKEFNDPAEMKRHELEHSSKLCGYCSIEFDSKEDYINHARNCSQTYNCKFCAEKLQSKKDLIEHVNSCHDNFMQKCTNCSKTLTLNEVQGHNCDILSGSFQCKSCQSNFPDEASLVIHISEKHKTRSMLTCKFCAKKFSLKSSLNRHEKSHSGVKPYQCKFCPRKFKDNSACIVHTRTHTGEHPFQCQECHKDFKQLANLKMHTYRHHKKNQKLEEKTNIFNQTNDYEHLYDGEIVETYSDTVREYEHLNDSISNSFNQSMNLLIPDDH